jgi:hypothetical protein
MSGSCGRFPMRREEIRDWVVAHRDELPTTLAGLAAYPIEFRKVILNFVSPDQRLAFWREHLATFVGDNSVLSADQRTFVAESVAQLPELFSAPAPNPTILGWEAKMARLFSRQEAARIFGTVGPPEPPDGLPLPPGAQPSSA